MEQATATIVGVLVAAEAAGQEIPYFSPAVAVLGTFGVLVVLWKFQRSVIGPLEHRAADTDGRLRVEAQQRRECEWRFNELGKWLRGEGLFVPDEILYGRPPWETSDDA